jgi:hypothetical protein
MASLKLLLGLIPSTSKLEQSEKALTAEFDKLNKFAGSETLAKYSELKELVSSSDFVQKRKEIEALSFKGSEEFGKEKEFLTLQKSKDLNLYFKTVAGTALKKFRDLDGSDKIKTFETLEKLVGSAEFKGKMKSKEFRNSEDAGKLEEYNRLKDNSDLKEYYAFKKSKELANFLNIDGSSKLARYNELKDYVASKEFTERKAYLLDKKRFEKTEMFKQVQAFDELKKNEDIIWYHKVKDSNKFDLLKQRELVFSDEFEGDNLNTKTWLTNYYWGDKLLKDNYTVGNDLQAYTEKENFEVRNSLLKIITRAQKKEGKVWTPDGFRTKEFAYTSGLINTALSFRQKYGIFSAKVKLGNPAAKCAFWMLADKITPHIDVCRTEKGKVVCDYFTNPSTRTKGSIGARYANDFFIYTLEWTPEKLVWKINDTEILTVTSNVPQDAMYILFSGGLDKPVSSMTALEIDWVRVYQMRK